MSAGNRKLILITGIPGTGKSTYGEEFSKLFGFIHFDLENRETLGQLLSDPDKFIEGVVGQRGNIVVTWGFLPNDEQIGIVKQFKDRGFKLVWFDGNRPAALRAFIKRRTVPEELFYLQMFRIENSKAVQCIKPLLVNTFDQKEEFKDAATVLREIAEGTMPRP
jgi:hypothetical protein